MPKDPVVSGFFTNSVTQNDAASVSVPGIFNFIIPVYGGAYILNQLPSEAPPYVPNNKHRDTILSITPLIEGMWANAVNISISKIVSRGYEFKGPDAQVKRVYDMFDLCDAGNGFHKFLARHLRDYKTTDNGAWVELERETDNPGSPVISFHHLDSLRCWRTGDPETPIYYYDLMGHYHALKWWQCFNVVDMASPRAGFYNSGECAATRAYRQVRKLAAMDIYVDEKLTGSGATEIEFVQGVTAKQIEDAMKTAEADQAQKGVIYYKGKVVIPVLSDLALNRATVNLKGVPDGFDRTEEYKLGALTYAKALGLVPTDLDPQLTARGALGVGKAEEIQAENAQGYGDGVWEKQFTDAINRLVIPSRTTFAVSSRNLTDEKLQAEVTTARATAYKTMGEAGFIRPQQGTQLLVDAGDLPEEFLQGTDQTLDNTVEDTEQVDQQLDKPEPVQANAVVPAPTPAPVIMPAATKELDALIQLTAEIKEARQALRESEPWYRRLFDRFKGDESKTAPQTINISIPPNQVNVEPQTIHMPAPIINVEPSALKQSTPTIIVNVPPQPVPAMTVNVPAQPAPIVNNTIEVQPTPITIENKIERPNRTIKFQYQNSNIVGATSEAEPPNAE